LGHQHNHSNTNSTKNIASVFWLNTFFALVELAGGFYTNSVAIMSDALHDFGDSLSLGLSWYFQRKSSKGRDEQYSYGYKRFSLLGAFITALVLLIGSIFVIRESVLRVMSPEQPNAKGMILLAIFGITVNAFAMMRLKRGSSLNERVVSLHFLEDVLGWVAVLIGSIVMMLADLPILDPILSIVISVFILVNVFKNLQSVFKILLQAVPENVDEGEIRSKVLTITGVCGVHDIRSWSMDGQYNILTLHVVYKAGTDLPSIERIKQEVRHCLQHLKLHHITIETESEDENCDHHN
jgi:cobalt-zinc-cadmium efflux system protein